jgi:hypothetical protein
MPQTYLRLPEGEAEIDAANLLTIAAMYGDTAGTFVLFRCKRD